MFVSSKNSIRVSVILATLLAAIALMIAPRAAWGQAMVSGSIGGEVTDPTGAIVPGAIVTLTDTATKATQTVTSNKAGHFLFPALKPGIYDVSIEKAGFQKLLIPGVTVTVSQATTLNEVLKVGAASQTVEVTANATAQLQTMNATMGETLSGNMMNLPAMNHDVASLLNYSATAAPSFHGTYGDVTSGSIAGATPDQNTFILDGATNTSGLEGDNGYINGFSGSQAGVVPTPVESIQEVTINTNNSTADFGTSSGAEMLAVTKRGTDTIHGSGFDFFQSSLLNANTWSFNQQGLARPKSHENFFGGDIGGPILPSLAGGKTYMYFDYEGLRNPDAIVGAQTRAVPGDPLRQGIVQVRTSQGVQAFNLSAPLNVCGPTGGLPCDPRNTGMSSIVSTMWNQYMPEPNALNTGGTGIDELNTFAFRGNLTEPQNNNELIGRIDHNFGSKLHFMSRYSWYKQDLPTTNQVDIGGLLPGDTKGRFASASSNNNQPAQFVAGLEANLTPNVTNSFHFGYTKNGWQWLRNGNLPQFSGQPGPIEIDGESTNALIPVNVDTQDSRARTWQEHNYDFRDELDWVKGKHFLTFGGDILHEWWHFDRYDNVVGGLTVPVIQVNDSSVNISSSYLPQGCLGHGGTATSNCIDLDNQTEINTYKQYYADVLGIVDVSSVVATRSGANLSLNPLGTPARSFVTVNTPSVYFTDTWRVKPSLTFNYGLNWELQSPPHDLNGSQDVLVDPNNNPITYDNYIKNRETAALNGQIYSPVIGFSPVGAVGKGSKYAFPPFYGAFGPRVSLAWNPNFSSGFLSTLFGERSTVIRGGYARVYSRDMGINVVSNPVLGYGFLQPDSCIPYSPNEPPPPSATPGNPCVSKNITDPVTAFRIGTNGDGTTVPFGTLAATLPTPVQPGIGTNPGAVLLDSMDQNFRPDDTDEGDFTIQRQLRGNVLFEVGWVGVWGHHLFQGIDMNAVPWMLTLGGQSFANAWAQVYTEVNQGQPVTAQPFFEAALGGASNPFCSTGGATSCSAALAAAASSYLTGDDVTDFFSTMETSSGYTLPQALYTDTGQVTAYGPYANTSDGFSNYQALVVKMTKHTSHGLTLNSNFTWGHALGTLGLAQTYTLDTPDNVYNLRADWTPQPWDRKFTVNALATYNLPFGEGQRFLSSGNGFVSRLVSGWSVSPIFTFGTGLPNEVYSGGTNFDGGGEMGAGYAENGASAVQFNPSRRYSNDPSQTATNYYCEAGSLCGNPQSVAVNTNVDLGGNGANLFGTNAISVFNSFRPFVLGIDGAPSPDGNLRNPLVWELDFGVTKDTRITERVHAQFFMQSQNFFNHNNWGGSFLDLQSAPSFGTVSGGLTGPRIIQLGLRLAF
ncbi:MAG TPA: carboxypeptidase-like regulatory domain-containing protein [Candidatus Acidoferrales bacterium]|nr:carboxypeptidase-like regulatory domain-containing protein [Candidatus Acidoferrales bacterium]